MPLVIFCPWDAGTGRQRGWLHRALPKKLPRFSGESRHSIYTLSITDNISFPVAWEKEGIL